MTVRRAAGEVRHVLTEVDDRSLVGAQDLLQHQLPERHPVPLGPTQNPPHALVRGPADDDGHADARHHGGQAQHATYSKGREPRSDAGGAEAGHTAAQVDRGDRNADRCRSCRQFLRRGRNLGVRQCAVQNFLVLLASVLDEPDLFVIQIEHFGQLADSALLSGGAIGGGPPHPNGVLH